MVKLTCRAVLCLLISILLFLSGCSKENQPASVPSGDAKEWKSSHIALEYHDAIAYACALNDDVYYIGKPSANATYQTVYTANLTTGENGPLEAFTQYQKSHFGKGQSAPRLLQIAAAPDHSLYLLAQKTAAGKSTTTLLQLDSTGQVSEELPLDGFSWKEISLRTPVLSCDQAGTVYLLGRDGILLVGQQGEQKISGQFDRLVPLSGQMGALSLSEDQSEWIIWPIDAEDGTLQESFSVKAAGALSDCQFCAGNEEYAFFCAGGLSLYAYRRPSGGKPGQAELILNWLNCDVAGSSLLAFSSLKDGGFSCVTAGNAFDAEASLIRQCEKSEAPVQTLTLGCRELPASLSQQILRFNRQNTGIRIEVIDYGATPSGFAITADRMTIDILSGKMPDLICTANLNRQAFIDQGLLEDLWPYIDADEQLHGRDGLVTPVFDALSQNGKLYEITGGFGIGTVYALSELVGSTPGWTIEEFMQTYKSMKNCRSIMSPRFSNRMSVLETIIAYQSQAFIDREAWTSSFDSPAFVSLLEYAALFPEESPSASYEEAQYWPSEQQQLMVNRWLINPLTDRIDPMEAFGLAPVTRIGYPGVEGNGSVFITDTTLSICAASEKKAEAWSFLRTLLLYENQTIINPWSAQGSGFLPTNRAAYHAVMEQLKEKPMWYQISIDLPGGQQAPVQAWTQDEIDAFWTFLSGITVVEQEEEPVAAIIRDEAARYFSGDQTAEAAAKAIQGRVNLYLGERK